MSLPSAADAWEAHDLSALNATEEAGRNLFFGKARCFACHNGPNLSDEEFHVTVAADNGDGGRGDHTGRLRDALRFKTPTLRQLSSTAPYFHDGSAATLQDVIDRYVIGGDPAMRDEEIFPLDLTTTEQAALLQYLGALESGKTRL